MSLLVVGSVAYDGIETPHGKRDRALGGSCTYISLAASNFTDIKIVAVVGDDFAPEDEALLVRNRIDLEGLERAPGKTFFWSGVYSDDMNDRTTITTDLNVFADFKLLTARRKKAAETEHAEGRGRPMPAAAYSPPASAVPPVAIQRERRP